VIGSSDHLPPTTHPDHPAPLRRVDVTRTYLSLDTPAHFRGSTRAPDVRDLKLVRHDPCPVDVYRRLYKEVGEEWFWHDRLGWSDEQLAAHLGKPNVRVWEAMVADESAGFFELVRQTDGAVEVAYFGLRPAFFGKGLGGWLLTRAVEEGWRLGARNVWLHTCTLDSAHALPNYLARGFTAYKTERLEVDIEGRRVVGERLLDD
jgi:GNAT superfamily N-acetyltransferase